MSDYEFAAVYKAADAAGKAAAEKCVPEPMYVSGYPKPVMDGVCGFAWVNVRPGNCAFANWLKKKGYARKAYAGGVEIWVSAYNQSMAKKEAYAYAFASVVNDSNVANAYGGSRMD